MNWTWNKGVPSLSTISQTPGDLSLTSGSSTISQIVPRIAPKEAVRTLGAYITTKQMKVLRSYSEEYYAAVSISTLSPLQAYCSYTMYLRPRLGYPLPCSSLTQAQCRSVQAPALAALLPKLHLNRHTPHAIVFGPLHYGSLCLPDIYTNQSYGQLKLLLGHLGLKDESGKLILIALSHIQLHTGSSTPFFDLPYPYYAKWVEHNWLTSIWKDTNQLHLTLEVEDHWLPTPD
jgi:hypothetical protein